MQNQGLSLCLSVLNANSGSSAVNHPEPDTQALVKTRAHSQHTHSCTGGKKNWPCICESNVAIYTDLQCLWLMPRSAPADTLTEAAGGRGRCTLQQSHKMSGDGCAAVLLLLCSCSAAVLLLR